MGKGEWKQLGHKTVLQPENHRVYNQSVTDNNPINVLEYNEPLDDNPYSEGK